MKTKDIIKSILEKWKFPILQEDERSVVFRYQMSYVQANFMADDKAMAFTLTGMFTADDEQKMSLALRACNDLNCNLLQVKLYIDDDSDLVIASEFFYKTEEDMEYLMTMALQAVAVAKKRFLQKYKEFEEEDKLLSELDEA